MRGWLYKIIFWLLALWSCWAVGLAWFLGEIPRRAAAEVQADAIVVLTGGGGRLDYGVNLLADDAGKALFISGVGEGASKEAIFRQLTPETRAKLLELDSARIALGDQAANTIGNAEETKRWLEATGYHRIALVTSSYHMPRSVSEFEDVMPQIKIIPAPVFSEEVDVTYWWRDEKSRTLILSEYHKYVVGKLRHWFVIAAKRAGAA